MNRKSEKKVVKFSHDFAKVNQEKGLASSSTLYKNLSKSELNGSMDSLAKRRQSSAAYSNTESNFTDFDRMPTMKGESSPSSGLISEGRKIKSTKSNSSVRDIDKIQLHSRPQERYMKRVEEFEFHAKSLEKQKLEK